MPDADIGHEAAAQRTMWSRPAGRALGAVLAGAVTVGLLFLVAPPGEVIDQIGEMNPTWVLVAIGLELGSCLSYVIIFRRFFPSHRAR